MGDMRLSRFWCRQRGSFISLIVYLGNGHEVRVLWNKNAGERLLLDIMSCFVDNNVSIVWDVLKAVWLIGSFTC
jgi:hypothetical protein